MPGGYVCSGSLKGVPRKASVLEVAHGAQPLRKLFSKEQRAFFAEHAPDGVALDDLVVLGPIFILKLKGTPDGCTAAAGGRVVAVSRWDSHPGAVDQVCAR